MTNRFKNAQEDLSELFSDRNPNFNVAHHLQARYLHKHKEEIIAALHLAAAVESGELEIDEDTAGITISSIARIRGNNSLLEKLEQILGASCKDEGCPHYNTLHGHPPAKGNKNE